MCDAGRIRHHLKHNLWYPESTVLFVGYQSAGTLGRALVEGVDEVELFDETIHVAAQIRQLDGVSGHADQEGLVRWLQGFEEKPAHVFVNHGDDEACTAFRDLIALKYGYEATAPYSGAVYDLARGCYEYEAQAKRFSKPSNKSGDKKSSATYYQLLDTIDQLKEVAQKNRNRSEKDLKKFLSLVKNLCNQWRR